MVEEIEEQEEQIKLEPKADIEKVSPCRMKLRIEIPAEKITQLLDRKFQKLNESVQVPGFRRGNAPRVLLERKFGKDIMLELKADMITGAYQEVIEEKKIQPVEDADFGELNDLELKTGSSFAYTVEVDVVPTVEIKSVEGLKVKKITLEPSEAEIDQEMEGLRAAHAIWEPKEGEAAAGDQVVVDLQVDCEGTRIHEEENATLVLGGGIAIADVPVPEFHRVFVGKKAGAVVDYEFVMPENAPHAELQGRKVVIHSAVKGIKARRLPEMDADFLKKFDCDTIEELRVETRKRLQRSKDQEAKTRMASELFMQLLESTDIFLPESLILRGAEDAARRASLDLLSRGESEEKVRAALAQSHEALMKESERSIRQHLIVDAVSKKEKIFVLEDEIDGKIEELAQENGREPAEFRQMMEEMDLVPALRRQMKVQKVLDFLFAKAQIE